MATEPSRPFAELAGVFLNRGKLRPKSRRDYERYLNRFDEFIERGPVTALTLDSAIRWRRELFARSPHVAKLGTSVLKSFAKWLAQNRHLRDTHGNSVLLGLEATRTPVTKRKPFSDEQLDAIWAALSEKPKNRLRDIAYVRLLYGGALRRTDVRSILRRNLDPDTRWMTVTVALPRRSRAEVRKLRLPRITVHAVLDYLNSPERPTFKGKPPEPLFVSDDEDVYTEEGFNAWVSRLAEYVERLTGIPFTSEQVRATARAHAKSQIHDPDLRRRCAGLLAADSDHDVAIAAACVVLEDRVRARSGAAPGLIGDDLMRWAFEGSTPRVPLATHPTELWGALNIYRGVAAFYRNGTAHRMRPQDFDPDEARRVVSLVDHLLGLID